MMIALPIPIVHPTPQGIWMTVDKMEEDEGLTAANEDTRPM